MMVALSVRVGDAVVSGESSAPMTADGNINRVYILVRPDLNEPGGSLVDALREILYRARIKIIVNKDVRLESEFVYEVPTLPDGRDADVSVGGAMPPVEDWRVRRGDTIKFAVEVRGDAPTRSVVLRAIFDILEAPAPTLN